MEEGIIYIATGDVYMSEAKRSAKSVQRELPNVDTTIFTDIKDVPDIFDNQVFLENPDHSNLDKVNNINRSPYDRTIFLDTDTYLVDREGITDLFELLEKFDFAACHGLGRRLEVTSDEDNIPEVSVPDSFAWFNSGVLAFRDNKKVNDALRRWREIFLSHRNVNSEVLDQGALREALYYSDARIATLPFEYNYHVLHPQAVGDTVRLLHGHIDNFDQVAKIVNREPNSKRYFYAIGRNRTAYLYTPDQWNTRLRHIHLSIKERGLVSTGLNLISWMLGGSFWSK